jgi:hypothetical protein
MEKEIFCIYIYAFFAIPKLPEESGIWQEGAPDFRPARAAVLIDTARARDEKSGAKPTTPKTDSSGSLGIKACNLTRIRQNYI